MISIAEQMRIYFRGKGYTQNEIANMLGVSRVYVNAIINGKSRLGRKNAKIWSDKFGFRFDALISNEGCIFNNGEEIKKEEKNAENVNINMILTEIAEQRKIMQKAQEQIDRLLALLQKKE